MVELAVGISVTVRATAWLRYLSVSGATSGNLKAGNSRMPIAVIDQRMCGLVCVPSAVKMVSTELVMRSVGCNLAVGDADAEPILTNY